MSTNIQTVDAMEVADDNSSSAPEKVAEDVFDVPSKSRRSQRARRLSGIFLPKPAEQLPEPVAPTKRRCSLKPKKNLETMADLASYFCNLKYKAPTLKNLETVYEEPVLKKGELVFMGPVKPRRLIFNGKVTKEKLRKRKTKVKCMKKVPKNKRISMDAFLKRLETLAPSDSGINSPDVLANLLTSCQLTTNTSP